MQLHQIVLGFIKIFETSAKQLIALSNRNYYLFQEGESKTLELAQDAKAQTQSAQSTKRT